MKKIRTMKKDKTHPELADAILNCCFEVMKELESEFLEKVTKMLY
jgi:hypothetical protein